MRLSSQKKTPRQTVGAGRGDLPGEGKDDLIIMQISREVKSYLVKTFNLLNGTSYSVDEMDGWRLYAFFRVPSDCHCVLRGGETESGGGMSLIQRMRQRAVAGELPTSEPRRATGSEKEGGEGQNTTGNKKTSLKPGMDVSHVKIDGVELDKNAVEGKWNMDYKRMVEDCKATCDKYTYTEVNRTDGRIVRHKGRVWRGSLYNTRLAEKFITRYNQWKPFLKEAYLVTITPFKEIMTKTLVEDMKNLSEKVNYFARRLRDGERAVVFRSFEYTSGVGLHAHLVVGVCESRPEFQGTINRLLCNSQLFTFADVKKWNVKDEPYYLTKTCWESVDRIAEHFEEFDDKRKAEAFDAWIVWHTCRLADVKQFAYPRSDPMKEECLPEKKPEKHSLGREGLGKFGPQFADKSAETRKEAVKIFGGTKCAACHKACRIADWLQKYVFCDNSFPYKSLGRFIKDGS